MRFRALHIQAVAAALAAIGPACSTSADLAEIRDCSRSQFAELSACPTPAAERIQPLRVTFPPSAIPARMQQAPVSGPSSTDAERVALLKEVIASTTTEWSAAFESQGHSYVPPRVLYLRPPLGHPGRGSGHHPSIGLAFDLGDVEALGDVFGKDARTLIALMVAHEVGHLVQQQRTAAPGPGSEGPAAYAREQQADCYAGWWLGRANARSQISLGPLAYPVPDLDRRIPEALHLLSVTSVGRLFAQSDSRVHGNHAERVAAIRRGLSAIDPAVCGASAAGR